MWPLDPNPTACDGQVGDDLKMAAPPCPRRRWRLGCSPRGLGRRWSRRRRGAEARGSRWADSRMLGRSRSAAAAPGRARDGSFTGKLLASVLGHKTERKMAWVSVVNDWSNEMEREGEKRQQHDASMYVVYLRHGRGRRRPRACSHGSALLAVQRRVGSGEG